MSVSAPLWRSWLQQVGGRIRWHVRLGWERIVFLQLVSVAVIGFGIGVALWVNRPLHSEVRDLQADVPAAAIENIDKASTSPSATTIPVQALVTRGSGAFVDGLMAFLPTLDLREQQLHTLHGLAADSSVELVRVEYGHGSLEHLPGQRMTMQLTMSAEYIDYRKFLHNLLIALPNLAIDRVTMEKAPGQATRLNVRLEASLYYRDGSSATIGENQ